MFQLWTPHHRVIFQDFGPLLACFWHIERLFREIFKRKLIILASTQNGPLSVGHAVRAWDIAFGPLGQYLGLPKYNVVAVYTAMA